MVEPIQVNSKDSEKYPSNSPYIHESKQDSDMELNTLENNPRWLDNNDNEVANVFGFNQNAELVNGRAAMFGFLLLILTELVLGNEPVTRSLFGIG